MMWVVTRGKLQGATNCVLCIPDAEINMVVTKAHYNSEQYRRVKLEGWPLWTN